MLGLGGGGAAAVLAGLRGDETVLDVATGAGLLLVGAAKRLPRDRVVGVDRWAAKNLSGNAASVTARNAAWPTA